MIGTDRDPESRCKQAAEESEKEEIPMSDIVQMAPIQCHSMQDAKGCSANRLQESGMRSLRLLVQSLCLAPELRLGQTEQTRAQALSGLSHWAYITR